MTTETADAILRDLVAAMPAPSTRKLTDPWERALRYTSQHPSGAPPAPSDAPAPAFRWADGSEGPFTAERDRDDVVTVWDANNRRLFSLNVVTQLPLDDEEALEAEAAEALALASQIADAMNAFERAPADPVKAEMLAALKAAHHETATDVDGITRDEALALISTLRLDLAAAIARAEGTGA